MSGHRTDPLHDALDAFIGTVFWSDDEISLEDALTEAIEDWVALASAEFNESMLFCRSNTSDRLAACLVQLATATECLSERNCERVTVAEAIRFAANDWTRSAAEGPQANTDF